MRTLVLITTALFALFAFNCYTILKSSHSVSRAQHEQQYFTSALMVDPALVDNWFPRGNLSSFHATSTSNHDHPPKTQAEFTQSLSFHASGTLVRLSEFGNSYQITHNGRYRIISDTVIVCFDDESDIEKYLYSIADNRLTLTGIWKNEDARYNLTSNNLGIYHRSENQ